MFIRGRFVQADLSSVSIVSCTDGCQAPGRIGLACGFAPSHALNAPDFGRARADQAHCDGASAESLSGFHFGRAI